MRERQWFKSIVFLIIVAGLVAADIYMQPVTTPEQREQAAQYVANNELPPPPQPFTHDGCTLWPDKLPWHDFTNACLTHDIAYWAGGSKDRKESIDLAFFRELTHTGLLGYFPVAHIMYTGVFVFGDSWLTKQLNTNWGYGWNE